MTTGREEKAPSTSSIRVDDALLAQFARIQLEEKIAGNRKPTYSEIIDRLLRAHAGEIVFTPPAAGEEYELPPHRRLLVEHFLAFWEDERSPIAIALKLAICDAIALPELKAEIETQARKKR